MIPKQKTSVNGPSDGRTEITEISQLLGQQRMQVKGLTALGDEDLHNSGLSSVPPEPIRTGTNIPKWDAGSLGGVMKGINT